MTDLARLAPTHPIEVLREQLAPDASDAELAMFAQVCTRLDLSPFADQIVLVGRYDNKVGRKVHRHQITVAGRRTLAARTGRLARIEGPVWCGPRERGELVWRDVWDDDDNPPYCARALVFTVDDRDRPAANGTAKWSEFCVTDQSGVPTAMWRRMPSNMLGKCAESLALRRAFPDVIDPAVADQFPYAVSPDVDDVAELEEAGASATAATITVTGSDQVRAHQAVAAMTEEDRDRFLGEWRVDVAEVWPADVVADALGRTS